MAMLPGVALAFIRTSWRLLSSVAPSPRHTASCAGPWSILGSGSGRHTHRAIMTGQGAGWPGERHYPVPSQARHTAVSAQGPAHHLGGADHLRQHHPPTVAGEVPCAQPGRKRLAVHARQVAVEPHFKILRRHPRPRLLCMEPPHQSAVAHHVTRTASRGRMRVCQ